jgi:Flp pilus assembly protein TadG
MCLVRRLRRNERGSAFIELALSFPMLFFLLLGALDLGFYCYSLISVQDAARMVALYTSSSVGNGNSAGACQYLLSNLSKMPNLSGVSSCSSLPLELTLTSVTGPDSNTAVQVTVSYQTISLIPIYGLPSQLTIIRTVEARRRS